MIFISYARNDSLVVGQLRSDIETAGHDVWIDERLEGGQDWWQEILERISSCALFVFALSPDSIQSRACGAELGHAVALRRPILPVHVREVDLQSAPDPVPSLQIVDYRVRTPEMAIELTTAINRTPESVPLPDPPPTPPDPPYQSFGPLRNLLTKQSLSLDEQRMVLQDLADRITSVDERETATALLHDLRARPDLVQLVAEDVDVVLMRAAHLAGLGPAKDNPEAADRLRSSVTQIQEGCCTPILGWGLTDSLIGPRQLVARKWADTFDFPMAVHQREDLPQVAGFVAAMVGVSTLRKELGDFYREVLTKRYPNLTATNGQLTLGQLITEGWRQHRADLYVDPHEVLADLPCRIYVTAQPYTLLAEALQANGKAPEVEVCRWRPDVHDWPESVYEREPAYKPTPERPLVFHIFGNLDFPDSLVITEDDYIDFLAKVSKDAAKLIPAVAREALADSALMLLGFRLEEWDFRILLRSLVQPGAKRLERHPHVAAQVDISNEVLSPERARDYLERYFGKTRKPSIDIYWGTAEEFAAGLAAAFRAEQ